MNKLSKLVGAVTNSWDDVFLKNMGLGALEDNVCGKPYEKSELVYICISTTARAISQVPLIVYQPSPRKKADQFKNKLEFLHWKTTLMSSSMMFDKAVKSGELEPVGPTNPYQQLLNRPNKLMDGQHFIENLIGLVMLNGNVWIVSLPIIDFEKSRVIPDSLWVIKKDCMDKRVSGNSLIGWEFIPGDNVKPVDLGLNEVIHTKFWNPYDQVFGISPTDVGQISIRSDYKASKYNENFFDEGAVPAGVLSTQSKLGNTQFERTKQQFEQRHKGYHNAKRVAVLEQGLKYTGTGLSQQDMDYIALKKYTRETLMQIYGMKKAIISVTDDVNYATAREQRKEWWSDTNLPLMRMITSSLNFSLMLNTPFVVKFDTSSIEALHEEYSKKVETGFKLWQMGFTGNEVNDRLELGFVHTDWRDLAYAPLNLQPITMPGDELEDEPEDDDEEEKPKRLLSPTIVGSREKYKAVVWKGFITHISPLEVLFEKKVKRVFYEARKKVLRLLNQKDFSDIDNYNFRAEKELITKYTAPIYYETLKQGGESIITELGLMGSFDLTDPLVLEYMAVRSLKIKSVISTLHKQVKRELHNGAAAGESISEIATRLKTRFNVASNKAKTIARTEVVGTANFGRHVQIDKSGFREKEWFTALDELVRPAQGAKYNHRDMQGKKVKIGEPWITPMGSSLRYPGDYMGPPGEIINCRCIEGVVPESAGPEVPSTGPAPGQIGGPQFRNTKNAKIYNGHAETYRGWSTKKIKANYNNEIGNNLKTSLMQWKDNPGNRAAMGFKIKAARMEKGLGKLRVPKGTAATRIARWKSAANGISDDRYLRMRALNQVYFEKKGLKTKKLRRGIDGKTGQELHKKLKTIKENNPVGWSDTTITLDSDTLTGYTTNNKVARKFGLRSNGIVVTQDVPVKNILVHKDLFPTDVYAFEEEFIIAGGKTEIKGGSIKF